MSPLRPAAFGAGAPAAAPGSVSRPAQDAMSHVIATEASGRRLSQLSGPILGPLDCDVRQTRCVKGVFKSQCVHPKVGGSDRDPGVSRRASVRTLFFGLCPGQCPLWPAACGHPSAPREPRVARGPRCWVATPAVPPPASARSSPQMQIRVAQTFVSEADSFSDSSSHFLSPSVCTALFLSNAWPPIHAAGLC